MQKTVSFLTMEKMDNRVLNSVGSSRIRARWLLPYWEEAEEYVIGRKYDVMIFQKVYWASFKRNGDYKGIKILDLCDPDWLENKPIFEYVDWVDATVTSTQPLADYIKKLRPNALVRCIPDRVYLPEAIPVKQNHEGKIKSLVWFGYSQNTHYLLNTFDELIARNIQLTIVSNVAFEVPLAYRNKLNLVNIPYNYSTLNHELIKHDAVLMPDPHGDLKSKFKSNNKTLQAWSLGLPIIKVPEDLDKFMEGEARQKEAQLRLKEIKEKWDVKFSVEEYKALIKQIKQSKK